MTKAHNVDAQRLSFILNELRLPAIKVIWPSLPNVPTRRAGPPPDCSLHLPSMKWPNVTGVGSNVI